MATLPDVESRQLEEIKPPLDPLEAVVEADRSDTLQEIQLLVDAEWGRLVEKCGG